MSVVSTGPRRAVCMRRTKRGPLVCATEELHEEFCELLDGIGSIRYSDSGNDLQTRISNYLEPVFEWDMDTWLVSMEVYRRPVRLDRPQRTYQVSSVIIKIRREAPVFSRIEERPLRLIDMFGPFEMKETAWEDVLLVALGLDEPCGLSRIERGGWSVCHPLLVMIYARAGKTSLRRYRGCIR